MSKLVLLRRDRFSFRTKGAKKGKVKNNKSDDMNAQVIQAAYRKYQVRTFVMHLCSRLATD